MYRFESRRYDSGNCYREFPQIRGMGLAVAMMSAVFVPGAMLGETVEALVVEYKKKMATAQLQRLIAPSPERIDARCPQSGRN